MIMKFSPFFCSFTGQKITVKRCTILERMSANYKQLRYVIAVLQAAIFSGIF